MCRKYDVGVKNSKAVIVEKNVVFIFSVLNRDTFFYFEVRSGDIQNPV
jgi:hypothetical protein